MIRVFPALAMAALLPVLAVAAAPIQPPAKAGVAPLDVAGLQKQIAAHRGRVLVVNFWATWCGPCKEEFPDLVRLQTANKAKGLDLLSVSFDDAKDVDTKVIPFLAKNRLSTGTFVNKSGVSMDEAYIKYLEPNLPPEEAISLPRTYVFDRKGKLVKTLVGGQTYAEFQKTVAPLLAAHK